jgi:flavin-dependent dehydrogenase
VIDLLIAGGGPAGLATALYARRAGLTAVVVEPRTAPIDKACGEGLMPHAVRLLDELGVHPQGMPMRGIRYVQGDLAVDAAFRLGTGLGVRRTELHRALHDAALASGVEIVRARVDAVEQAAESVRAIGIEARYLVAADGLHSSLRRAVDGATHSAARDPAPRARRWGMRAHLPVRPWTDHVEVHWSAGGEAYVTPVAPDCVGIALLGGRGGSFAERLRAFPELAARLDGAEPGPVLAAGPMRQDVAHRVSGRVLLVGDAAGYLDALTGEGLALAFGCARALVARVAADQASHYERDYRVISRRYRLITSALLAASGRPTLRRQLVPTAARVPWLFGAAVDQLAR